MTLQELFTLRDRLQGLPAEIAAAEQVVRAAQRVTRQAAQALRQAEKELAAAEQALQACKQACGQTARTQTDLTAAQKIVDALQQEFQTLEDLAAGLGGSPPARKPALLPEKLQTWAKGEARLSGPAAAALKRLSMAAEKSGNRLTPVQAKSWRDLLQVLIKQARQALAKAQAQVTSLQSRLQIQEQACKQVPEAEARVKADKEQVRQQQQAAVEQAGRVQAAQAALAALQQELARLQTQYPQALDRLLLDLDTEIPLTLLPVRLETRYAAKGRGLDLLVRIYPDDLHQDSHEVGLTADEIERGQQFWEQWWRLGSAAGEQDRLSVWNALVSRYGSGRSAWIAASLAPKNPQDQPQDKVPMDQPLNPAPDFPTPAQAPAKWSRPACARALPDRWAVLGYQNGRRTKLGWGELIPETLATGPDPADRPDPALGVDAGMRWMVDFAAAEKKGMGLRLSFAAGENPKLERLVVLGVKATLEPEAAARAFADLLRAHRHTWGLGLVPQDTPTNNTDDARSGYAGKPGLADSLAMEMGSLLTAVPGCDGDLLQRAWGLGPESLGHAAYADGREQETAGQLQAALWPGVWEYYLYNMLVDASGHFPDSLDLSGFRDFYVRWVRARGPLPALRVGNQPYGVLPVTSLDRWVPWKAMPEALLLSLENGKANLRLAWDVTDQVAALDWVAVATLPIRSLKNLRSASLCLADLNRDGRWELLGLFINQMPRGVQDRCTLGIGRNLNSQGVPGSWQWLKGLPECPEPGSNEASALAVADLGPEGDSEVWVLRLQRRPKGGQDVFACLSRSRWQDAASGPGVWEQTILWPSLSGEMKGAGLGAVTFAGSLRPEPVLFYAAREKQANRLYVGFGERPPIELKDLEALLPPGDLLQAAFAVYTSEHGPAVLAACVLQTSAGPAACLFQGQGLDPRQGVKQWRLLGAPWPLTVVPDRIGLAAGDLGRAPHLGVLQGLAGTVNSLKLLREAWKMSLQQNRVPHLGRPGKDVDQNTVETLALDGVSHTYAVRNLFGSDFLLNLARLSGLSTAPTSNQAGMNLLGVTNPRLAAGTFHFYNQPLTLPLVQAGELSETEPLQENYIQWLSQADPRDIQARAYPGQEPKALLYQLLRYAALWAYADAAIRLAGLPPQAAHRDPELIPVPRPGQLDVVTPWKLLDQVLKRVGAISDPELTAFLANLKQLSQKPTAVLERSLTAALDLNGHRLDAWITGLAAQRLWDLRQRRPTGLLLGGFGWVENLAPRPAGLAQSEGYLHAPSLAQATTGAVLRSGYLTHQETDSAPTLALDLSSRRVRLALQLMEGIRQGQTLGALLGYRFERGLHDNHPGLELDKHIAVFRSLYPLVAGKLQPLDHPVETVAADNVVDALALLRYWQKHQAFFDATAQPQMQLPVSGPEYDALVSELEGLADSVDACSDLAVAEGVYQAVQGNHLRAAAGLDALARGEVPPPELEVIRTPRRGWANTHRVLLAWNPAAAEPRLQAWNPAAARGQAEPGLNQWAAQHLGDPVQVRCRVAYLDPATGDSLAEVVVSLAQLQLCPLDALYLPPVSDTVQQSDWERRLVDFAQTHRPASAPAGAQVQLTLARDSAWPAEILSFPEFLEAVRPLREFVLQARALDARDLALPGQVKSQGWDTAELAGRCQAAWSLASSRRNTAANLLKPGVQPTIDELTAALRGLAEFSVDNGVPQAWGEQADDPKLLAKQLQAVLDTFGPKLDATAAAGAEESALDFCLRQCEALFGKEFKVLPRVLPSSAAATLQQALIRRGLAQDAPAAQVWAWLQDLARVREGVARWNLALVGSEAMAAIPAEDFSVAQLPVAADDRWVALAPPAGQKPQAGHVSLALLGPAGLDWQQPCVGLLVDEWVEVIPRDKEVTGISFHYDAPGACAPQSVLLAVSPDPRRRWNLETLEAVVLETFDAAKTRAVDLESLVSGGHYLPALCLAFNAVDDTFSVRFE